MSEPDPPAPPPTCAAVILAAGASTRLGQPKQLIHVEDESLLRRTARIAVEAACSPVLVVLGFEAHQFEPQLAGLPVKILINNDWQEGMGSSLRSGIAAVSKTQPRPAAALVLVCDQPRLSARHLTALLESHRNRPQNVSITASVYAGQAGVPAVFSAKLFKKLLSSSGDQGARNLLRAHAAEVLGVPWPEGGLDLDLPEDVRNL